MGITLNPMQTSFAFGTFKDSSIGYTAGSLYPNAAARNQLRMGVIASSVTGLVYGGVGVSVSTAAAAAPTLGPQLAIATALASLQGFVVWDQSAAGIQTASSPVPLFAAGQSVSFVEFNEGHAIALPISATNAANLENQPDNTALSWDYTNQVVVPYAASSPIPGPAWNTTVSAMVARIIDIQIGNSWVVTPNSPAAGEATWNEAGAVVVLQI